MAVESTQIAITKEGLIDIAKLVAIGVTEGEAGTTNFKVAYFRLGSLGNATTFEAAKEYRDECEEIYYMDYTANEFDDDHPTTIDNNITGYLAINSIQYVEAETVGELGTVEISCYLIPGQTNSLGNNTFLNNEIMVFTGEGTVDNPYRSFIWGIFPEITKEAEYGINFTISCQF